MSKEPRITLKKQTNNPPPAPPPKKNPLQCSDGQLNLVGKGGLELPNLAVHKSV